MLAREFVEDSLYNPRYGYFATKVEIFDPDRATSADLFPSSSSSPGTLKEAKRAEGFDFRAFASTAAFEDEVARRYMVFEGRGTGTGEEGMEEGPAAGEKVGRQVWHTPTELFKPWYARALARYILSQYLAPPPPSASSPSLSSSPSTSSPGAGPSYPYDDLIIYEIGAGNGTLMGDILDYIAEEAPEGVYERTRYRIVEISERLKDVQERRARGGSVKETVVHSGDDVEEAVKEVSRRGHEGKVEVVRKSIFEWDRVVEEPCFFLAMEVLDNFPHDVIRYDTTTHEPLETTIAIDSSGDFTELFSPISDPLLARYLSLRAQLPSASPYPPSGAVHPILSRFPLLRKAYAALPFAPNLSKPEFIPTRQLELLEVLRDKFPRHRLVMSDFSELPDAVEGECGPVVQTRYAGETVPCTTYLVQPGFFDIFFPTDFRTLSELYTLVMSQPPNPPSNTSATSSVDSPSAPVPPSPKPRLPGNFFSPHSASGKTRRELRVFSHADFLEKWAETDRTRVRDGSNPLLDSYQNAKFVVS
ncbi:hypothetical protein JCM11251_001356 [Rhodosporidiobolus azoricus]